jgi:hypothetical protein
MPTKLTPEEQRKTHEWNERYGIPFVPAKTKIKKIYQEGWSDAHYFDNVNFADNLAAGLYDDGIAIILGRTLTPDDDSAPYNYSFALDFDGWDAVVAWFGEENTWQEVLKSAHRTRIEWHGDKERLHYLFLSKRPIKNKHIKFKTGQLEVRCSHQPLFSCPSVHESGIPYTPLGIDKIAILDEHQLLALEARIDRLCEGYMSDENKQAYIKWLLEPSTILGEGQGRHPAVVTMGMHYYNTSQDDMLDKTDEEIKQILCEWHSAHCNPPRSEKEFNSIWKWIVDHCKEDRDRKVKEWKKKTAKMENKRQQHR